MRMGKVVLMRASGGSDVTGDASKSRECQIIMKSGGICGGVQRGVVEWRGTRVWPVGDERASGPASGSGKQWRISLCTEQVDSFSISSLISVLDRPLWNVTTDSAMMCKLKTSHASDEWHLSPAKAIPSALTGQKRRADRLSPSLSLPRDGWTTNRTSLCGRAPKGSGELRTGPCRASWEGGRTLHDVLGDATARRCDVLHSQLPSHECAKGVEGGAKDDDELAGSSSQLARAVQGLFRSSLDSLVHGNYIHMTDLVDQLNYSDFNFWTFHFPT
ncbi:hypothetical protein F5887DRAFT_920557 [Amanita rubescens]|nr:hypothetical protein F5887DRAFT_920557 [Amanita rubescens]